MLYVVNFLFISVRMKLLGNCCILTMILLPKKLSGSYHRGKHGCPRKETLLENIKSLGELEEKF